MPNGAWCTLLLFFLSAGGFLPIGACNPSLAQDCCSENPSSFGKTDSSAGEPVLEQDLLDLVNQHRIENGLPALTFDSALMQIAREHSQGMAQQGFISHNLPDGGLRSRMAKAGYLHEIARENVASAPTILKAQNALAASPGHESNMLATDVTRVGIGISRCPSPFSHQLFITEIFASPREEYHAEVFEEALASRVAELRQSGAGSMVRDPDLEQIASRSLNSIHLPYRREDLQDLLSASAGDLPDTEKLQLSRLQANVQLVHNPKNLSIPNYASEGQARTYGAAIRQVTDDQNASAFLVLTLIGITQ